MKAPGMILNTSGRGGRYGNGVLFKSRKGNTALRDVVDEARFAGYRMDGADLAGADLHELDLSGASMNGADLSGANLRGADLNYTKFKGANLTGAALDGAKSGWTDYRKARMTGASVSGLKTNRETVGLGTSPRQRSKPSTSRKEGAWQQLTGARGVAFAAEVDAAVVRAKAERVSGAKVYDLSPTATRTPRAARRRRVNRPPSVLLSFATLSVGLMSGPKLDTLIHQRPLGDKVTPTVAGVLLTLSGAVVADRVYHRRDVAVPLAALGLGLAGSTLRKRF